MTESFLHYIWQFQYFDRKDLGTADGEPIQVLNPGIRNTNAGPDFSDARIKIGELEWRGSAELHIKASGWNDHRHGDDAAYENVILHVVWENDKPVLRSDGSSMPTLELKNRTDPGLWNSYRKLFTSVDSIPCSSSWPGVADLTKLSMLDKVLAERLESKANSVRAMLDSNQGNWEETAYQMLVRNFGFKVNLEPFLQLSQALPYKLLLRHVDKLQQVEALLFGQAGFLEEAGPDEYRLLLIREYGVLSTKYQLAGKQLHKSQWRFLRLRPANFPTVRLAQLAALVCSKQNLISVFLNYSYAELMEWLNVSQSPYWLNHYQFGKKSAHVPTLGKSSAQNIIINSVVPLLAAYSLAHDDQQFMDKALDLLQRAPAEKNRVTRQWSALGYHVRTAFDSQALIGLHNSFCQKRRCLECMVGAALIRPK